MLLFKFININYIMNIIIPLGGKGIRFVNEGYDKPKSLIQIFDKLMIQYVLDNISTERNDNIYIIYNKQLDEYDFVSFMNLNYPTIKLIRLEHDTSGPAETLMIGLKKILNTPNTKSIVLDCDTFYTEDIVGIFRNSRENMVFYTKRKNDPPIYSYIQLDNDSIILDICEKNKISDNANTGAYAFNDIEELYNYCQFVVENNISFNNETYTSCVIKQMLNDNHIFKGQELDNSTVFSLGTPSELQTYINNTFAFLFDLDGTMVITDEIYFDVWFNILNKYNIQLTTEIFSNYIQGNNDKFVINNLLPNIDINLIELSNAKDEAFIKYMYKIKTIDGIEDMLKKIKYLGNKCCIVTNSNRKVADAIVKYIGFGQYIDFIICGDECKNGKPDPEPYLNAMKKYDNINNNKCFIFEDSKSGILSGRMTHPKSLIGIETIYSSCELINYGVNISIKNYIDNGELIDKLLKNTENETTTRNIKNMIKNSILFNISDIIIDDNKLKGGYIADIVSLEIKENNNIHNCVLKYENSRVNSLSIMAKQLDLYEREYYFYETISKHIHIKIPKYIGTVRNENNDNIGVILENLFVKNNFKINLNLKDESVSVALKIIDNMAKLHASFWNKDLSKFFPKLKKMNNSAFQPFFKNYMSEKMGLFKLKWSCILSQSVLEKCDEIFANFEEIQNYLSVGNLTFIHGDIKSPNIFYNTNNNNEPYFIDWQHCAIGKGTQDFIFFIIESFDITDLDVLFPLFKHYYYKKLLEFNVTNYTFDEYENDLKYSLFCVPFFTSIWFGTTPNDELIDANFPFFFIKKMGYLLNMIK